MYLVTMDSRFFTFFIYYLGLSSFPGCTGELGSSNRYSEKVSTFSTTVPRKVSEDGIFLSHYIPNFYNMKRKKRDLDSEQIFYIIPHDGEDYHVQLWPHTDFISPGFVSERHTLHGNKSKISIRSPRDTQCHYRGIVKGVEGSRVALSTCYGLAGHVLTPKKEFLIEPSLDENRESEYHTHYIYKREDRHNCKVNKTNCGTLGRLEEALKERLDWEAKFGEQIQKTVTTDLLENASNLDDTVKVKRGLDDVGCVTDVPPTSECPMGLMSCAMTAPQFLEVMVTIDSKLEKEFVFDLETFLLTVMNMVAGNIHDASIGQIINVKLVRIIYLGYTIPRLDVARYSPYDLLTQFCEWQLDVNPVLENHPNHHDFAIFITRFETCQGNMLGLTNMASVCRLDKACTVVSEEGLLLGQIITHQLGHSFGAEHDDGDVGGCAAVEPDGTRYHMSPAISMGSTAWSTCSAQAIGMFVSSRMSWCLSDRPLEIEFNIPEILPGQIYDAIQQCTLNFKMRSLACVTGDFCKELYCQISPKKCAGTGDPPAPGTPCAKDMWCFNGNCVHRGRRPDAVAGEWGPWTPWSSCTRSCGGGVQTRFRSCNNPQPKNGGAPCSGPWITHKMCAISACPGYTPSFADLQCKLTNKRAFRGHYYLWDHYRTIFDEMKCTLVCKNEHGEVSIRSPMVIDGTPCEPGTNNVCIGGNCRRVGCDFVIDSQSKYDMCGVCHGSGINCKVIHGSFYSPDVTGQVEFLKLPEGTGMVFVRETNPSNCKIVVANALNYTFYLNGPELCDAMPGEFNLAGVDAVYDEKNTMERVFARSPIQAPISVSIRCPPDSPMAKIRYQYALPENPDCTYMPTYKWDYLYWDPCNRLCGGGVQRARPACVEVKYGEVEDKYCCDATKPRNLVRNCNLKPCDAKWWVGAWSNCDCSDGEGLMTRLVFCMKPQTESFSLGHIVKDKECTYQPKPRTQRPCSIEKDAQMFGKMSQNRTKRQVHYEQEFDEFQNDDWFNLAPADEYPVPPAGIDPSAPEVTKPKPNKKVKKIRAKISDKPSDVPTEVQFPDKMKPVEPIPEGKKEAGAKPEVLKMDKDDDRLNKGLQGGGTTGPPTVKTTTQATCQATDIFMDQVFPEKNTLPVSCRPESNEPEPADLGPWVESQNSSLYKLHVIPVVPMPGNLPRTDIGLATFGNSLYYVPGVSRNRTEITGPNIFRILEEARRRATTPQPVDTDFDL